MNNSKFRVHHLMANVICWNIRGLNWPTKQDDVNIFLHSNKVGMIGLLEIKIKLKNVEHTATHIFLNANGCI